MVSRTNIEGVKKDASFDDIIKLVREVAIVVTQFLQKT